MAIFERWASSSCCALFALTAGATLMGCKDKTAAPGASPVVAPPNVSAARPATTDGAPPPPSPSATASSAAVQSVRCKALEKGKTVALGARTGRVLGLVAAGGNAYVLTYEQPLARAEVTRFARDGSKATPVGRYKGLGEPAKLVVTERAAFISMGRALVRMPLGGGEPTKLAAEFSKPIAVGGGKVYGIRCDKKSNVDQLLRVGDSGGEVEVAASWPRKKAQSCEYGDIAVDDATAFVADWTTRRLLAVDLSDGSQRELVTQMAFMLGLSLEPEAVLFVASTGLYRVPKRNGKATKLSDAIGSPFSAFAADASAIYLLSTEAYSPRDSLARVPLEGGKATELEGFAVADVVMGSGVWGIGVDDQCIYFTHNRKGYFELMARPK